MSKCITSISIKTLLLFVILLTPAFAESKPLAFPKMSSDFQRYVEDVKRYLMEGSLENRSHEQIMLNLPFELRADERVPYRGKFLLIHGLNYSPFVWHDVSQELTRRGFDVRAILLPGHGRHPNDMLDVTHEQWLEAARNHYDKWNVDDTPFYLGGFSLGSVISTVLAIENEDLSGLFLFSPAYRSQIDRWLSLSPFYAVLTNWLFGKRVSEDNPTKYNSVAVNSGTQYHNTTEYLRTKWKNHQINTPTLMVASTEDSLLNIGYIRSIYAERFVSNNRNLLLYSNQDNLPTNDFETKRNSYRPDLRILNQSHLSLIHSTTNPIYGGKDGLKICDGSESPLFNGCPKSQSYWYGARASESPDGDAVVRTTVNPDFHHVFKVFEKIFMGV